MNPVPESHAFLQFWIIIGFIAMVAVNIVTLVVTLSGRKQRREVSFTEVPASKKEFDQHVASVQTNFVAIRAEMAADRHANQVHASERSKTLFNQVEKTRSELDDKITDMRKELSERIDSVPDRVIATLKNTNAI